MAGAEVRPDTEPMAIGVGVFIVSLLIVLYFWRKGRQIDRAILGPAEGAPDQGGM
jgi:hypothetical protein